MEGMTRELPKCLAVRFGGKTLLEHQLEALRANGVRDISIVRGYQAEKIGVPGAKYYLNDAYASNNIMVSLFYAEPELSGDVLVSYSDIWYGAEVVKALMRSRGDVRLAVDRDWRKTYEGRLGHPVGQAEVVAMDGQSRVTKIGKIAEAESVQAEFTGLMALSARGCEVLRDRYHEAKKRHGGGPFQRAARFENAYLTDLIQEVVDSGHEVRAVDVGNAWREIDTPEDFERAADFLQRRAR